MYQIGKNGVFDSERLNDKARRRKVFEALSTSSSDASNYVRGKANIEMAKRTRRAAKIKKRQLRREEAMK